MNIRIPLAVLVAVVCLVVETTTANAQVLTTTPVAHSTAAGISDEIIFTFDRQLDPSSVPDSVVYAWGRWSGRMTGSISLEGGNTELHFHPDGAFFYGEQVSVRPPRTITFIDTTALTSGYTLQFWTGLAFTGINLQEITRISTRQSGETFIQSYGAYAGDINNDRLPDLIVPNEQTNDIRLFLNDGSGRFSEMQSPLAVTDGSRPSTNEGADFNRDGKTDFALGNSTGSTVSVFFGDGNGAFSSQDTYTTGSGVRGLCIGDFNADGWDDIVTSNRAAGKVFVLLNAGDGSFHPAYQVEPGGSGESGCAVIDFTGDGVEDLAIGNLTSNSISLLEGDGDGSFSLVNTISVQGEPWMLAAADLNGDGVPDIVSANSDGHNVSVSLLTNAGQALSTVHYSSGGFQLSVDLGDIDGDGDLDVVTSNYSSKDFTFWRNDGTGFLEVYKTLETTGAGSCMILHDRDGDGDLDATGIDELDDLIILYENVVEPTGVTPVSKEVAIIQVFPNPASDQVTIMYRTDRAVHANVAVYDVMGRLIAALNDEDLGPGVYDHVWDTRNIPNGTYFLIARTRRHTSIRSITVVH